MIDLATKIFLLFMKGYKKPKEDNQANLAKNQVTLIKEKHYFFHFRYKESLKEPFSDAFKGLKAICDARERTE